MEARTGLSRAPALLGTIQDGLALVGTGFIAFIALMTGLDVVLRIFGHPLRGVIEITQLCMVPLIWLGMAYTMRVGGHVRMEMLSDALFKGRRGIHYRLWVHVTLLIMSLLMCIASYNGMVYSITDRQFGDITNIPVYPFKILLFAGCVTFAVTILVDCVLQLASLFGDDASIRGGGTRG